MPALRTDKPSDQELKEVSCKGRNGYFQFGSASVWLLSRLKAPEIFVQIYSRQIGNSAPIQFSGPAQTMMHLFADLACQIREQLKEIKGIK